MNGIFSALRSASARDKCLSRFVALRGGLESWLLAHRRVCPRSNGLTASYDRERLEDVGFLTSMTLVLLGNYAQTGHFGGPLAYTPYNVATHLAGPDLGGLRFDYRRPKHPYSDKFMLAGGHCIPTCYALWMIMGQALERKYTSTGDRRYYADPAVAILPDRRAWFPARRGRPEDACCRTTASPTIHSSRRPKHVASRHWPATRKASTSPTTSTAAPRGSALPRPPGKAAFWDMAGASMGGPKIVAFEGEFAMTEGHAQELKTQALAMQVGKRLRVMFSDNNAGIDDSLIGGVISSQVRRLSPHRSVDLLRMERLRRGRWQRLRPGGHGAEDDGGLGPEGQTADGARRQDRQGVLAGRRQAARFPATAIRSSGYPSHPYAMKMNSEYFVALAQTFEQRYGVEFEGIRQGPVKDTRERLIQFKTNMDVAMSVLDKNGLGDWLADHLVEIGESLRDDLPLRMQVAPGSVPRRSAAREEPPGRTAEGRREECGLGSGEGGWRSRSSASLERLRAHVVASPRS